MMEKKGSLIFTNKFLRDPRTREQILIDHAAASARIEGVKNAKKRARAILVKFYGVSSKRGR